VDTQLIIGVESVLGANLAAALGESGGAGRIVGLPGAADSPREAFSTHNPSGVIHCGPAPDAAWASGGRWDRLRDTAVESAVRWAQAAADAGRRFTLISPDAVFTGPWMFHEEDCPSYCHSPEAALLRELEERVLAAHPRALVVRTHAFGWSPGGERWIEAQLAEIGRSGRIAADTVRHATPILAADLADILAAAARAGMTGLAHAAGAERVNPTQFLAALAREFGLPRLHTEYAPPSGDRACGFGRGETSLDSRRIRLELGMPLPMLADGLARLRAQRDNGYRERLLSNAAAKRPAYAA
jgi:dTDP-4-dehydrorhamnose reductase